MRKWIYYLILILLTLFVSLAFLSDVSFWNEAPSNIKAESNMISSQNIETTTSPPLVSKLSPITEKLSLKNPDQLISLSTETILNYTTLNPDFRGWLKIKGTQIDMPLVQGTDNDHYLEYNFKNQFSFAGSLYFDYRNQTNFKDRHAVIYGHYMKDGTMFHDLHAFKDENFYMENRQIELYGLSQAHHYEIFSIQIVSADTYTLNMPKDDDALEGYVHDLLAHSIYKKEYEFPEELKLLTLVTCTYEFDNARLLIHAVQVD